MTLLIAFMIMAHVGADWTAYPVVILIWIGHLAYNYQGNRK